ncbi:MAG TPA: hypothetical protein VF021_09265 [Longimicrobiales bacterium]
MNTCVALVGAYLRFNGYVTVPEQPVLIGEGRPYRYHTATDVDILAVRFPNAAVVVPRAFGSVDDDLHLAIDPVLDLHKDTVDVLIGEVKSGRPRLNEGLRDADVLYATLRRVDPGFDQALEDTIQHLIRDGEAHCHASGKRWRFRLVAFGEGQPALEGGPYMVVQLRHVAAFLINTMSEHHEVWKDAQFGDAVLDLLHLFDKMGFEWALVNRDTEGNPPTTEPNQQPDELKKTHNQNGSPKKQAKKRTRKPVEEESTSRTPPVSMKHAGNRNKLERN